MMSDTKATNLTSNMLESLVLGASVVPPKAAALASKKDLTPKLSPTENVNFDQTVQQVNAPLTPVFNEKTRTVNIDVNKLVADLTPLADAHRALDKTSQNMVSASKIGKVQHNNPLTDWSAEIVDIDLSPSRPNQVVSLRQRTVDIMHGHARKEDTVASIKIVKENTNINSVNDNFRAFFTQGGNRIPAGALDQTDVLFESSNFMLQVVGEADTEKYQVIDSFGKPQI
jgi:hypothetical protein